MTIREGAGDVDARYRKRKIIRMRYNTTYTSYESLYREEQWEKYDKALQALSSTNVPLKGIILDDGCGTGLLIEYLMNENIDAVEYYICLDISENMLSIAYKRIRSNNLGYLVELLVADAQSLPLRSSSVDLTLSFTVFTLLDSPREGIAEAIRVTRHAVLYTLLKVVPRLHDYHCGVYVGETSKDQIFLVHSQGKRRYHCLQA